MKLHNIYGISKESYLWLMLNSGVDFKSLYKTVTMEIEMLQTQINSLPDGHERDVCKYLLEVSHDKYEPILAMIKKYENDKGKSRDKEKR